MMSSLSRNGVLQTSLDMSHSKINEKQECGRENPFPQVAMESPLTNGHAHLVNGALKPEDLSPATDEPFDKELPECTVRSAADKPLSPPTQFQTKPDPYEFPHSPPKQCQAVSEQRLKPPPSTYEETLKAAEAKTPLPPASQSFSHCPFRLNGSYHNAFSSEPASFNTTATADKPDPPTDKSSSSESSANLLVQTGHLISEYYSRSRLHQISTWRIGFSEYVNELNSKRKAAGGASFPGKDRLRKYVAQRFTVSQGMNRSVPMLLLSCW